MAVGGSNNGGVPAASAGLAGLAQPPREALVGYQALWYLPQADLLAEPLVAGGAIAADLALRPGAVWRPLPFTPNSLKFEEKAKSDRHGTRYQVKLTAQRPPAVAGVLAALDGLDRRPLLLLVQEHGGGRRLVGGREEFVQLLAGTEGGHPGTRAGLDLELAGDTTRRAPYYRGAVPLPVGQQLPPVGRTIQLQDRAGNLLAIVPLGSIVTIRSGFRVAFTVTPEVI